MTGGVTHRYQGSPARPTYRHSDSDRHRRSLHWYSDRSSTGTDCHDTRHVLQTRRILVTYVARS